MTKPARCGSLFLAGLALGLATTSGAWAQVPTELSVLSYNIEGLPWPARSGRGEDLSRIADQLRALRAEGRQPQVVLFEEAFSHKARAIAQQAGIR